MKDDYIKLYIALGGEIDKFNTRLQHITLAKHAIRRYLYTNWKFTYDEISDIENEFFGVKADHTTIRHSVKVAAIPDDYEKKFKEIVGQDSIDLLIYFIEQRCRARSHQYKRELIDKFFTIKQK